MMFAPNVTKLAAKGDVNGLIKALGVDEVRDAAEQALKAIGAPAVEPLIGALRSDSARRLAPDEIASGWDGESIGFRAASALQAIGAPGVEALIAVLHDKNPLVRRSAVYALSRPGNVRAVEPLIGVLGDEDGDVRYGAVSALHNIRDTRAVEPLASILLHDKSPFTRKHAVHALWYIGDARAVASLITALDDGDEAVRSEAARALDAFGASPDFVESVRAAAQSLGVPPSDA